MFQSKKPKNVPREKNLKIVYESRIEKESKSGMTLITSAKNIDISIIQVKMINSLIKYLDDGSRIVKKYGGCETISGNTIEITSIFLQLNIPISDEGKKEYMISKILLSIIPILRKKGVENVVCSSEHPIIFSKLKDNFLEVTENRAKLILNLFKISEIPSDDSSERRLEREIESILKIEDNVPKIYKIGTIDKLEKSLSKEKNNNRINN